MRLRATQTERVTVEVNSGELLHAFTQDKGISAREALGALRQKLCNSFKLPQEEYCSINEAGTWQYDYEVRGGSHGWDDTKVLREATSNEKYLMASVQAIEKQVLDLEL